MDSLTRERLPTDREGVTLHLTLGTEDFYARVGQYPDGRVGELFLTQSGQSGSHVAVLLDGLAQAFSLARQHGVPLATFIRHWKGTHAGDVCGTPSADPVRSASSILDALAKWMEVRFAEEAAGETAPPKEAT